MPLYEYQCDGCGRRHEVIRKFSDPPLVVCPSCGGALRKLFSSPAIQFKGSGFYITDYPKKDQANTGKTEKTDKTEAKSDGSKTETAKTDLAKGDGGTTSETKTGQKGSAADSASASATASSPSAKTSKP